MTPAARAVALGLVCVTVASETRRVDLALPGAVPVAELLPELARSVGLLDPATVHGGYRLATTEGRRLDPGTGLTVQGVEDGALLTVTAGVDEPAPRVHDDVAEAMAAAVEHGLAPWRAATGRRTALGAAALLLLLGAVALLLQRDSAVAATVTTLVTLALCAGAIVLSRVREEGGVAVGLVWIGAGYGAVAGVMLAGSGVAGATALAAGGAGALVVGAVGVVGLGAGRTLALPPLVVGGFLLAVGTCVGALPDGFAPAPLLTAVLAALVAAGTAFPRLALGATRTRGAPLVDPVEDAAPVPAAVAPSQVAADARIAHEILLSISVTVGVLLVLLAPVAVSLGVSGALLVVVGCVAVLLRTRQHHTGSEVLVGLVSGTAGLASTAVAALVLHDGWHAHLAVVLVLSGTVLLVVTLVPGAPSARRGRWGDLLESAALLALLPLLVLATGLFDQVRRWVS